MSSTSGGISSTASCTVTNNVLTITNAFGSSGSYTKNSAALSFIFSTGGTNPSVVADAGSFVVETYATVSGT